MTKNKEKVNKEKFLKEEKPVKEEETEEKTEVKETKEEIVENKGKKQKKEEKSDKKTEKKVNKKKEEVPDYLNLEQDKTGNYLDVPDYVGTKGKIPDFIK